MTAARRVLALVAGLCFLAAATLVAAAAAATPDRSAAASPAVVSFAVALRTYEQRDAALADQTVAQSPDPRLRAVAGAAATEANRLSSALWALLDRWDVPGVQRLPGPDPTVAAGALLGPTLAVPAATVGLRHACGLVGNDELADLAELSGPTFDARVHQLWTEHTALALQALDLSASDLHAPGLSPVVRSARQALQQDLSSFAAA